jgi:hypothetical protein
MALYGVHIPQMDYLLRMSQNVASPRSYGLGTPHTGQRFTKDIMRK